MPMVSNWLIYNQRNSSPESLHEEINVKNDTVDEGLDENETHKKSRKGGQSFLKFT